MKLFLVIIGIIALGAGLLYVWFFLLAGVHWSIMVGIALGVDMLLIWFFNSGKGSGE